jgi:nitrite reductase/ring-hydroxylating ferredoxin subunit
MTPSPNPVPPPLSRRTLLVVTGLGAAALGGLASCGTAPPPAAGAPGPQIAKVGDIPVGGGTIFAASETVVTQPAAGEFKAFSSICTHARCPVTEVTTSINCLCHGSRFSLTDGSVLQGPAASPLAAKTVTVNGGTVEVAG